MHYLPRLRLASGQLAIYLERLTPDLEDMSSSPYAAETRYIGNVPSFGNIVHNWSFNLPSRLSEKFMGEAYDSEQFRLKSENDRTKIQEFVFFNYSCAPTGRVYYIK